MTFAETNRAPAESDDTAASWDESGRATAEVAVLGVSPNGSVPPHCDGLGVERWTTPDEAAWLLGSGQLRPSQVVLVAEDVEAAGWSLGKLEVAGVDVTNVLLPRASVTQAVRTNFQLQKAIDNIPAPIFSKDAKGVYGACNEAFERFVGLPRERIMGRTVFDCWDPELATVYANADQALFDAGGTQVYDAQLQYADGSVHDVTFYKGVFTDEYGATQGLAGAILDITERRELEQQLQALADTDPLTGGANRALFSRRLDQAAAEAERGQRPTVLLIDLDDFKTVNDTLGHSVGDELLVAVTALLGSCARESDTVARLGGDEFAVLVDDVGPADVEALVRRIEAAFTPPFVAGGHSLFVRASVGVAHGLPGDTGTDMLRNADIALYVAKENGKSRCAYYSPEMQTAVLERAALLDGLRDALARDELFLEMQPIYRLGDNPVVGVEALARWRHPARGLVPPEEFIPIAESRGLIVPLGWWALREACTHASTWPRVSADEPAPPVHVNVSSYQLREPGFAADLGALLAVSGMEPGRLVVEITETAVADEHVVAALDAVRALGVHVALDDFGTGQSSLSALASCPVDVIKVDKSFVERVTGSRRDAAIPIAIVQLAENLGIRTIAEGVETAAQAQRLAELGYREAQGYHFTHPMPPAQLLALLGGERPTVVSMTTSAPRQRRKTTR